MGEEDDRPRRPTGQNGTSAAQVGLESGDGGAKSTGSPHILSSDKPKTNKTDVPYEDEGENRNVQIPVLCDLGFGSHSGKTGTYCSFVMLVVGIVCSIVAQGIVSKDDADSSFISDCPAGYEASCRTNQAVLRFSMALVVVFGLDLILTIIDPHYFDSWWVVKYFIFIGLCVGFYYADASVFDHNGYAWFARIGGFLFIMMQQVILLDFAMTWGEKWESYSAEERGFSDQLDRWRIAILGTGLGLLIVSIVCVGLMFHYFTGCVSNDVINSLCLLSIVLSTAYQLSIKTTASILTSGVMSAYFTYVAFSALTLGSDLECNPTISGNPQLVTTIIGMIIVTVSLCYTVYNTLLYLPPAEYRDGETTRESYSTPGLRKLLASVIIVFILGSCYYAMVLTNWSTLQANFKLGNARQGETAMWLQASAQWICAFMYVWAMTAPLLFPDRFK